jgi:hypothetical protein
VCLGWTAASIAVAEQSQQKKTAPKKSKAVPKKAGAVKTSAAKTGTAKKGTAKKGRAKGSAKKKVVPRYAGQRVPTQERYKEIQQALASKGYLQGTPDGMWSQQSVDALKRFQQDQNLDPSGKINSLSLIALGLGPRREQQAALSPPVAQPQP